MPKYGILHPNMVKNSNYRGLRRTWEFFPTLRGIMNLPPRKPHFLARLTRWQKHHWYWHNQRRNITWETIQTGSIRLSFFKSKKPYQKLVLHRGVPAPSNKSTKLFVSFSVSGYPVDVLALVFDILLLNSTLCLLSLKSLRNDVYHHSGPVHTYPANFKLVITRSVRNELLWALRYTNVSLRCGHFRN